MRFLLGACASLMLVIGTAGWVSDQWPIFYNSMLRAGILLFGIWLAYPQLTGGRWKLTLGWVLAAGLVVVILAYRPRLIPIVTLVLLAIFVINSVLPRLIRRLAGSPKQ